MSPKTRTGIVLLIIVGALAALAVVFVTSSQQQAVLTSQSAAGRIEEGAEFMQQNANQPGVITTASGLQYRIDRPADGPRPSLTSEVTVHYRGTLLDGTVFDSSYDRNEPIAFPLNGVIQGWQEGLQLMPVGSQFTFWIPPQLGYGPRGIPGTIPGNAVLVFQVELLSFE